MPISEPCRQTTSQSTQLPSSSMKSSNVSGADIEPVRRNRAPVSDRSRTLQASVEWRPLKQIVPALSMRRRALARASAFVANG